MSTYVCAIFYVILKVFIDSGGDVSAVVVKLIILRMLIILFNV